MRGRLEKGAIPKSRSLSTRLHQDEAEALRLRAFKERRSEAALIREAVRRLLGVED
jgi:hypothetical protein